MIVFFEEYSVKTFQYKYILFLIYYKIIFGLNFQETRIDAILGID